MATNAAGIMQATSIPRGETGKRILLTVLFVLVVRVLEAVLGVLVLFQLAYALITGRAPDAHVTGFADRVLRYCWHVGQYLTHNTDALPFPFGAFPAAPDAAGPDGASPATS